MTVISLRNKAGLEAELLSHGALRRLMCGPGLMLNLFPGNELEGGPANVWLRRRDAGGSWRVAPLLGPLSPLSRQQHHDTDSYRHEVALLAGQIASLACTSVAIAPVTVR